MEHLLRNVGPPSSTGSSSNASGQQSARNCNSYVNNKQTIVINYADLVREQLDDGISDNMRLDGHVAAGSVDGDDISIGFNHEPTSPMRHLSSHNLDPEH